MVTDEVARHSGARRVVAILTAFALFAVCLLGNILRLDVLLYEYYRQKTYDQITTTSPLKADRGCIYDSNMNLLHILTLLSWIFYSIIKRKSRSQTTSCAVIDA